MKNRLTLSSLKNSAMDFVRPALFVHLEIHDLVILQLLVKLCLGFSHLNGQGFKHNFLDFLNSLSIYTFLIGNQQLVLET